MAAPLLFFRSFPLRDFAIFTKRNFCKTLNSPYDTIVYLRKEETDKLKYYLIVGRYLFSILTLLHSLSGEKRKLIKFSPCCQGNKAEKKELKGYKNPGLVKYFLPNALPHYCSSEKKRKLIKFNPCCERYKAEKKESN